MHSSRRTIIGRHGRFRLSSRPPTWAPWPAQIEDTELTVAILDLTYEYEPPEGDDAYELDIADAEDDEADVEDMEDEDPDARSQTDGDFGPRARGPSHQRRRGGSRQRSKAQREPATPKLFVRSTCSRRGHRNSVLNPNLRRSGQSTK